MEPQTSSTLLQLPVGLSLSAIRKGLSDTFTVRSGRPELATLTFYDTFEWNIWFSDKLLFSDSNQLHLAERKLGWRGEILQSFSSTAPESRFPSEWSESTPELEKLVELRALLPIAEVSKNERTIELLNADRKVVFRFGLDSLFAPDNKRMPFYRFCRPLPLRGYDKEATQALALLNNLGMSAIQTGPLDIHLPKIGRTPEPYTLRPVFGLTAEEPARQAVRQIVQTMLSIGQQQQEGIIDDIDTEFLHDYRICLRKIRSVISLVKGVYLDAQTTKLKNSCATLARNTNLLRDLDVYLMDREEYTELLPESLRDGLEPLFDAFQKQRDSELKRVRRHLKSATYAKRIAELDRFFSEADQLPPTTNSEAPIKPLVSKRIYKRYQRIISEGSVVTDQTPDEAVHAIRIQCKKLRYMLEFFGELFDEKQLATALKQLKLLQNRLGRFNDYTVQQASLLAHMDELGDAATPQLALAIGGLVAVLNARQIEERKQSQVALKRFSENDVQALFKRVFKKAGEQK